MTVSISERLSPLYEGNGINTRFDFTFRVFDQEDATGISVKYQVGTDFIIFDESLYDVTINEDNLGGYVTFKTPPIVGFNFYVVGETPVDQLLDITNYDNFYPDAIERSLDKLTAILQEWKHLIGFETQSRTLAVSNVDNQSQERDQQIKNYTDQMIALITGSPTFSGVTTEFVTQNGISQQNINLSIINYVNPKMFGAVGDGITDDAQAIRDCFNYMIANGATFNDFSKSKYFYASDILVSGPNKSIIINGNCAFVSVSSTIQFTGSIEQIGYVSFTATKGSKTLTLNQNVALYDGDLIAIHNSRVSSLSPHRTYYYDGEFKIVESVADNVVTLKSILETTYPAGTADKVWKINPITLDMRGVKFASGGVSAVKVSFAANSYFDFHAINASFSATSQNAFYLDRSHGCYIAGGNYIKSNLSGSGSDYGIIIGNSQDILNEADYSFGARHGVAVGGSDVDMSVPNRRIYTEKAKIENKPASLLHAADFHGNVLDSHYKDNNIQGRISLSGYNTKSIGNKIHAQPDDVRAPIGISEAIGGTIESIGDEIVTSGSASYIMGFLASSTIANVSKDVTFALRDIKFSGNPNLIGILSFLNLPTNSNIVVDGFELVGSAPIFDRLVSYSAGTSAVKPSFIQITRPKYAVPDSIILIAGDAGLAGVRKQVFSTSGSNENGTWIRSTDGSMECSFRVATTLPITTTVSGGYKSTDIQWTYPKAFISQPRLSPMIFDNASVAIRGTSAGNSSAQLHSFSTVSVASAGINFDITAKGRFLY